MTSATVDLLQEAARLYRQGALVEAANLYRQVLQNEPDHAQAHYHLAVISCQQGRFREGLDLARHSLASDPGQPRAHNLVGMALSRLGRQEEALMSFDNAIVDAPDFADAHGNRANALMELGRVAEAVTSFEHAVALQPDSVGDLLNLGTALHRLGRHEDAISSYDRVLALHPNVPEAHFNRANVLARLERYQEALASYDRALAINRRYVDALNGRSHVLLQLGKIEGALVNFEEMFAVAPDHPGALDQMVSALIARGETARALAVVMRALAAKDTSEAKALFVRCVRNGRFGSDAGGVRAVMLRALSEPWDRPTDIALPAVSLVKLNPAIKHCCVRAANVWPTRLTIEDLSGRLTAIADDELLRALLETVPVCDVELERCLTGIRSILLDAARESPMAATEDGLFRFCCALARQCFINEYVFDATADELERVLLLQRRLTAALKSGSSFPPLWLVVVAAYLPLHSLTGADALLDKPWPASLADLLTQQVRNPRDERRLHDSIPHLTAIANHVSLKVKQQYEENPYPRWVKPAPATEPKTMEQYFGNWFIPPPGSGRRDTVEILVAGCGTGQYLAEMAQQFKGAQVLAVDLSVASLCYAKRQAVALGLGGIKFAAADILELGEVGRHNQAYADYVSLSSFDIVDASGVLHHTADPWEGWRVLLSLLRPGGFMRVGLYSRFARRDVNAARAFVAGRGLSSSTEDIRRGRQEILALADGEPVKNVAKYLDFFTTSECRDAFFHVHEQQMTLPEIASFVGQNNVEFVGFVADPRVIQQFQARFPQDEALADLARWHVFEEENPNAFAAMYQFWIRKSAEGITR
jgi:tetratricopeptide (TPR) repeat protein/SAM-dependent methyltransferase